MERSIRCELVISTLSTTEGPQGSCGLDFWWSPQASAWIAKFLNAIPATLLLSSNDKQASLRLFLRRLPLGLSLASTYPYGCFEGDLELLTGKAVRTISKTLRRHGVVRAEAALTGEYTDQLCRAHIDWQTRPGSAALVRHVVDLDQSANIPEKSGGMFGRKIRWAVNRARKDGCHIEMASEDDADLIQEIYARAMIAKGAPVNYSVERFRGILRDFSPIRGQVMIGYRGGLAMGIAAYVDAGKSRHLLQLAVLPEAMLHRLSDLLVFECMHDAITKEKCYFDFMASHVRDVGLMEFKAKWGGEVQPIHTHVLPSIPGFGLALDVARAANQRWGLYRVR